MLGISRQPWFFEHSRLRFGIVEESRVAGKSLERDVREEKSVVFTMAAIVNRSLALMFCHIRNQISRGVRRTQSLQGRMPSSGLGGSGSIAMNSNRLLSGSRKKTDAAGIQASTTGSCVGAPAKSLG